MGHLTRVRLDPSRAREVDDLIAYLRRLRIEAGGMSIRDIQRGIRELRLKRGVPDSAPSVATIHSCFQPGRKRLNVDTVTDIAAVLGLNDDGVALLRQGCQLVMDRVSRSLVVTTRADIAAAAATFTGRRHDLDRVLDMTASRPPDDAPLVITIEGMAGVGKTTLAQRVCQELESLGDGYDTRLSVDLRGYDPTEPGADPDAVIRGFLVHLGMSPQHIDGLSPSERREHYARLLAERRALILLDNAADETQLRPILLSVSPSTILVTSRRRLHDLDGAARLPLEPLSIDDALDLLRRLDPSGRVDTDATAATRLVHLCRQLPIELAAVGSQLASKPDWSLSDHVERLKVMPSFDISRPAFAVSYQNQSAAAQRLFRLLALHPGREFTDDTAAVLSDLPPAKTGELLRSLFDEHLLLCPTEGRYQFHDSIRDFATTLVHQEEPASGQRAAQGRVLDHYRQRLAEDADPAWIQAERSNLMACLHLHGHDEGIIALVAALHPRLRTMGYYDDVRIGNHTVLRLAQAIGDRGAEADALSGLAEIARLTGQPRRAEDLFRRVLVIRRQIADHDGEAHALRGLAQVSAGRDFVAAADYYRQALDLHRRNGNGPGEAETLWGLLEIARIFEDYATVEANARSILEICRRVGNRIGEAHALCGLGTAFARTGDHEAATTSCRRALSICLDIGNRRGAVRAWRGLGEAALAHDDADTARDAFTQAREIGSAIGDRAGEAHATFGLAEVARLNGDDREALALVADAQPVFQDLDDDPCTVLALDLRGDMAVAQGDRDAARAHWEEALVLATRHALPQTARLRAKLDGQNASHDPPFSA